MKSDAWQGAACRLEQILEYVFGSGVGSAMGRREFIRLVGGAAVGWPLAKTAKTLGLTVPPSLLARGDEVIE